MQVCNNCGTVSQADDRTCPSCRMTGNFTIKEGPQVAEKDSETKQCQNCGNMVGLHFAKCPECRFPFKSATVTRNHQHENTFVIGSLRAG